MRLAFDRTRPLAPSSSAQHGSLSAARWHRNRIRRTIRRRDRCSAAICGALSRQGHATALLVRCRTMRPAGSCGGICGLGVDTSRCRTVAAVTVSLAICETRRDDSETVFYRNGASISSCARMT